MNTALILVSATMLTLVPLDAAHADTAASPPDTTVSPLAGPADQPLPQPPMLVTASLTGATNYLFRGISQTENDPAVFGSVKVSAKGFYAAVGAENVDFHTRTDGEYDLSAGWAHTLDGFNVSLGVVRYGYIDQPVGVHNDTVEAHGAISHQFGPLKLGAGVHYAFEYFGTHRDATYVDGFAAYTLTKKLTASGGFGRQQISAGGSYSTWSAGMTYALFRHVSVAMRYVDTNAHRFGTIYGSHVVGSLNVAL
jgi:uncharacterized protein (TIGR02001 family)